MVLDHQGEVAGTAPARLWVDPDDWGGTLDDGTVDWWLLFDAGELVTLRVPDGREAQVVITRHQVDTGQVTVLGSGPPPI